MQKFVKGEYVLCVSNDILEEYEEVLGRNINSKVARLVLVHIQILPNVKFIDPHYSFGLKKQTKTTTSLLIVPLPVMLFLL